MACQILLPRLGITDLMALGEAVAVGVDPTLPAGVDKRRARPVRLDSRKGGALIHAVGGEVIPQNVA